MTYDLLSELKGRETAGVWVGWGRANRHTVAVGMLLVSSASALSTRPFRDHYHLGHGDEVEPASCRRFNFIFGRGRKQVPLVSCEMNSTAKDDKRDAGEDIC